MKRTELVRLAKVAAVTELTDLRKRVAELEDFLGGIEPTKKPSTRKRSKMSKEARALISQRMQEYWAKRRKTDKKTPKSPKPE